MLYFYGWERNNRNHINNTRTTMFKEITLRKIQQTGVESIIITCLKCNVRQAERRRVLYTAQSLASSFSPCLNPSIRRLFTLFTPSDAMIFINYLYLFTRDIDSWAWQSTSQRKERVGSMIVIDSIISPVALICIETTFLYERSQPNCKSFSHVWALLREITLFLLQFCFVYIKGEFKHTLSLHGTLLYKQTYTLFARKLNGLNHVFHSIDMHLLNELKWNMKPIAHHRNRRLINLCWFWISLKNTFPS